MNELFSAKTHKTYTQQYKQYIKDRQREQYYRQNMKHKTYMTEMQCTISCKY